MANPNIVNVTDIRGKLSLQNVTTSAAAIVANDSGSNKVFKINTLIVSNIDSATAGDITVDIFRSAASTKLASTISIPADATLVVISKETSTYLQEGDSLRCLASANNRLQAVCSYEEIS